MAETAKLVAECEGWVRRAVEISETEGREAALQFLIGQCAEPLNRIRLLNAPARRQAGAAKCLILLATEIQRQSLHYLQPMNDPDE